MQKTGIVSLPALYASLPHSNDTASSLFSTSTYCASNKIQSPRNYLSTALINHDKCSMCLANDLILSARLLLSHTLHQRSITKIPLIVFRRNSRTYTPECTWMDAVFSGMPNEPVSIVSSWYGVTLPWPSGSVNRSIRGML